MAIKTTVVGSYPVPHWLVANHNRLNLRDAIMVVLKTQELAGIDVVADGELNRFDPSHPETNGMIDYFVNRLKGIRTVFTTDDLVRFRARSDMSYRSEPAGVVVAEIDEGSLNLQKDFEFVRPLTKSPLKFTCTGPHMLSKVMMDRHYGSPRGVALGFARALRKQLELVPADVVQIDEANIAGHPDDTEWALPAVNHVLETVKGERAVHICFGNYGGQTVQKGTWKSLLEFMNGLEANHLVLEFARRGFEELEVLRDVNPRIGIGVGVIDIKDNEIETPDLVAQRIETVSKILGPNRIRYVHPDCGFWMLQRSVADGKMRALVKGRDLFEGRQ
jgi:5-methyltetrahydropteroyltriglutamate--homocysteine methyltransferase